MPTLIFKSFNLRIFLIAIFVLISVHEGYGQQVNGIQKINSFVDSLSKSFSVEKLYLQTDKPSYNAGDTLWFKGYLFEAKYLTPSAKSGLVYADIIDKDNRIIKRMLFPVSNGLLRGSIPLDEDELQAGAFTLRAYTNWMRNWGPDYIFTKSLFLINPTASLPVRNASSISTSKGVSGNTAVYASKPENVDLQFMPEGGNLVSGLQSRIGFKAVAENGMGINVAGKIYNDKKQEMASFKTTHAGMGFFEFTPIAGEDYFAKIITAGMESKPYALPKAETSGVVLKVINDLESDVLKINLAGSKTISDSSPYYLVAQSRGVVCYGAIAKFKKGEVNTVIQKNKFPTGIVRITLFDENLNPINERITFINHRNELNISLQTDKENYYSRDSVSLQVKVTNKTGEPVQGSFSVAVTDDGLVATDAASNILTRLLLTSDLKGTVENPAFYLVPKPENWAALESLLLTQGWIGYRWNDGFKIPRIKYPAQPEFTVSGKLTNLLNKGAGNVPVKLFSKRPFFVMDTISNPSGEFTFRNLPAIDTGNFVLQAINRNGKSMNVGFQMQDEQPLPVPPKTKSNNRNSFTDSTLLNIVKNNVEVQKKNEETLTGKNVIEEVVITAKKIVKGSKNLNGPGNADEIIDEKEMLKAGKMPLIDLLNNRITGFNQGMFPVRTNVVSGSRQDDKAGATSFTDKNLLTRKSSYMVKVHRAKFIFDGIDAESYFQPADIEETPNERWLFLKGLIDRFTAEDIKGLLNNN